LICSCLSAFYDTGTVCVPCHVTCLTCGGSLSTDCVTCLPSVRVWSAGSCLCTPGTFSYSESCLDCHPNCLACTGANNNECSSCIPSAQLISTSCVIILNCGEQVYHLGICKSACPDHYYNSSGYCAACESNCVRCDAAGCLECQFPYLREGATCVVTCSRGFVKKAGYCQPCSSNCLSCGIVSTLIVCSECATGYSYYDRGCVAPCPGSMFSDAYKICRDCQPTCLACLGSTSTQCLSCHSGYALNQLAQCLVCMS
jgi:hypothetical protein